MNDFGITKKSTELLLETFAKYGEIEEVVLFGSRAKGNYKKGSDIDFAIKSEQNSAELVLSIQSFLNEELAIPYMIDIVDYHSLSHRELKEHIDRVGKTFYRR